MITFHGGVRKGDCSVRPLIHRTMGTRLPFAVSIHDEEFVACGGQFRGVRLQTVLFYGVGMHTL